MRILITGAGGMLAQDLAPVLASKHDVLGVDRATCDITDPAAIARVFAEWRPELIVNCAAFPDVDGCERDPERAFAVNGRGPGYLARAAESIGARLIHISTDYVFDGRKRSPYLEDDPANPIGKYGQSKLEGEREVLANGAGRGPQPGASSRHLVVRSSWLYGIHKANFVEKTLADAQVRDHLDVVADQLSCPTWTWHLAKKILELVEAPAAGILHVAASGECSRQEMACYIVGKLPRPIPVAPITWAQLKLPAERPAYSVLGSRGLKNLGLEPLPHWKAAVDEYFQLRQMMAATKERQSAALR